jgi:hypothetical protein
MAIKISSALYGCSRGGADVTDAVQNLVNNGNDDVKVTNQNMGGDPAQGHDKFFSVKYMLENGTECIKCCKENETLDLVD